MMQQTTAIPPHPTCEALATMLTPAEREILEALGEIIALDLLRQRDPEGAGGKRLETDSASFPRGCAC